MKRLRIVAGLLVLVLGPVGVARAAREEIVTLDAGGLVQVEPTVAAELGKRLEHYAVVRLDFAALDERARSAQSLRVRLAQLGFTLDLAPYDIRGRHHREFRTSNGRLIEVPRSPNSVWRGAIEQEPGSEAVLLLLPDLVMGVVSSPHGTFQIEPLFAMVADAPRDLAVLFRPEHIVEDTQVSLQNDVVESPPGEGVRIAPTSEVSETGLPVATVATEADALMYVRYGSAVNAVAQLFITVASVALEKTGALVLQLGEQHYYETSVGQPFDSTDPDVLLRQFREHWNAHHTTIPRDVAHLFTKIDLQGTTIGKSGGAFVWYFPSYAYSLTLVTENVFTVTVHELGHDLGLKHYCVSCDCPTCASKDAPVMCPCARNPETIEYQDHDGCVLRNFVRRYAPGGPLLQGACAASEPAAVSSGIDAPRCDP
jgi:hypothetical protein